MKQKIPNAGFGLSKEEYDKMLNEYYESHDWDSKTGLAG